MWPRCCGPLAGGHGARQGFAASFNPPNSWDCSGVSPFAAEMTHPRREDEWGDSAETEEHRSKRQEREGTLPASEQNGASTGGV